MLRNAGAKVPWGTIASAVAKEVGTSMSATTEVVEQLKTWGTFLSRNALSKWTSALVRPVACEHTRSKCNATGVVTCQACGRRCCLAHVRVSYQADGICETCVATLVKTGADPLSDAFRALGLDPNVGIIGWAEVKRAYRKLVVKHNADVPQGAKKRAENTKRMQALNAAFAALREHFFKEKAA